MVCFLQGLPGLFLPLEGFLISPVQVHTVAQEGFQYICRSCTQAQSSEHKLVCNQHFWLNCWAHKIYWHILLNRKIVLCPAESESLLGWRSPLRSSSPPWDLTPACQPDHDTECHIQSFLKLQSQCGQRSNKDGCENEKQNFLLPGCQELPVQEALSANLLLHPAFCSLQKGTGGTLKATEFGAKGR